MKELYCNLQACEDQLHFFPLAIAASTAPTSPVRYMVDFPPRPIAICSSVIVTDAAFAAPSAKIIPEATEKVSTIPRASTLFTS